ERVSRGAPSRVARRRRARPPSRPPAAARPRPTPARAGRSSFLFGEPREDRLAREPPLLSNLATGQLVLLGKLDHDVLVDLEQAGELRGGQDLELRRRPERMLPEPELGLRARHAPGDVPRPDGVFRVELRDELRDPLAPRRAQHVGRPVELLGLGRGDSHIQGSVVALAPRSRHRRYLDIKLISRSASREVRGAWSVRRTPEGLGGGSWSPPLAEDLPRLLVRE